MKNETDFWHKVWCEHARKNKNADPMTRIMRTHEGHPVASDHWRREARYILRFSGVRQEETVLELCCGNGMLTEELAARSRAVDAIDYVPALVSELKRKGLPNVSARCGDVRKLHMPNASYNLVIMCAGIQYLSFGETVDLMHRIHRWLKPGGRVCLIDVPDCNQLWKYASTPQKRGIYFDRLRAGRQLVGTWYEQQWFLHLAEYLGFSGAKVRQKPSYLVYYFYRFDVLLCK